MGWVLMSERDVRRIEVLTEILSGRRTVASAAIVLAISVRQVHRLLIRFREDCGGGLIHRGRGQSSNHRLTPEIRAYALELVRTRYADFGPTLAIEVLLAKHDIKIGRETLRTWMVEDGLWLSRKQRRSFHQPRLRRESYGELVQIDGSDHRWFEQRGEPCTLLVFIDDATSKLMQLRFVPSESTDSYFGALQGYLNDHGCPVAFYSDKHTVFRVNKPDAKGGSGMTQFGRALAELNSVRQLKPGQGPRRTSESDVTGSSGERAAPRRRQRYGSRQHVPTGVREAVQREVLRSRSEG
jgi:hypothetical protein